MKSRKYTIKYKRIYLYVIAIFIILNGNCMYKYIDISGRINSIFKYCLLLSSIFGILIFSKKRKYVNQCILGLVCTGLYLCFYIFLSRVSVLPYLVDFVLYFCIFYLLSYILIVNNYFNVLLNCYKDLMFIIAFCSVILWFLGPITNLIMYSFKSLYYWGEHYWDTYSYYGVYFHNPTQTQSLFGLYIPRNCGIFTEGTGFAEYLLYAFLIEKYWDQANEKGKFKRIFFFIAMISTQSTKIFLILIILYVVDYIIRTGIKSKLSFVKQVTLGTAFVIISYKLINTLLDDKAGGDSFLSRFSDIIAGFAAFKSSPVVGVGYRNYNGINIFNTFDKFSSGITMGVTALLAQGGIIISLFYATPIAIIMAKINDLYIKQRVLLCIMALFLNLCISNAAFTNPYIFILSTCYAYLFMKDV